MKSRAFNKRIEIWETTKVPDGFGGNTVSESLLKSTWANIKTLSSERQDQLTTQFGLLDASSTIQITVRKRNDTVYDYQTLFIKYRNAKYAIITYAVNEGFEDRIEKFICAKEPDLQ